MRVTGELSGARRITLPAMVAALSVVLLLIQSFLPTMRLVSYTVLSLLPMVLVLEGAGGAGALSVLATILIGFIVLPNKLQLIPYGLFFGWYGMLRTFTLRWTSKMMRYIVRWAVFEAAFTLAAWLTKGLFVQQNLLLWVVIAVQPVFFVYDWAFGLCVGWYLRHMRKSLAGSTKR